MQNWLTTLILLSFLGLSLPLFAQEVKIKGNLGEPDKKDSTQNYQISVEQWENNERIKNNFNRLTTIPFYTDSGVQLDFGPVQFQIKVPF